MRGTRGVYYCSQVYAVAADLPRVGNQQPGEAPLLSIPAEGVVVSNDTLVITRFGSSPISSEVGVIVGEGSLSWVAVGGY